MQFSPKRPAQAIDKKIKAKRSKHDDPKRKRVQKQCFKDEYFRRKQAEMDKEKKIMRKFKGNNGAAAADDDDDERILEMYKGLFSSSSSLKKDGLDELVALSEKLDSSFCVVDGADSGDEESADESDVDPEVLIKLSSSSKDFVVQEYSDTDDSDASDDSDEVVECGWWAAAAADEDDVDDGDSDEVMPVAVPLLGAPLKSILKKDGCDSRATQTVKFCESVPGSGGGGGGGGGVVVVVDHIRLVDDKRLSLDPGGGDARTSEIRALVNKTTFDNLEAMQEALREVFNRGPFHRCLSVMWSCVLRQLLLQPTHVDDATLRSICVNFAALVAAMHRTVDSRIGEYIAHRLCLLISDDRTPTLRILAAMLGSMYAMCVISAQVLLGFMSQALGCGGGGGGGGGGGASESAAAAAVVVPMTVLDALIYILRNHRRDLRVDDEEAMAEFVEKVTAHRNRAAPGGGEDESRVRFCWDELANLCADKSQKNDWREIRQRLATVTKVKGKRSYISLEYSALKQPTERFNAELSAALDEQPPTNAIAHGSNYKCVAIKLQMRTPLRERIIKAVVESSDYIEAVANIEQLRLREKELKQVIIVLVKMTVTEKPFNEFYPLLAVRLCKQGHDEYRRQVRLQIRRSIAERGDSTHSSKNLTKLISRLLEEDVVDFRVLKSFHWCENVNHGRLEFVRHIVTDILRRKPIIFFKTTFPDRIAQVSDQFDENELLLRFLFQMLEFKRTQDTLDYTELLKLTHLVMKLEAHINPNAADKHC